MSRFNVKVTRQKITIYVFILREKRSFMQEKEKIWLFFFYSYEN